MGWKPTIIGAAVATAFNASASFAFDKPHYASPPDNFWNRFEFLQEHDDTFMKRLDSKKYHTGQVITTYVDMVDVDDASYNFPMAFQASMPSFSLLVFGESSLLLMLAQQKCFMQGMEEGTKDSIGLSVKKYHDNSLEIMFTEGRYAGAMFMYSNQDRHAFINYYAIPGKDGFLYSRPGSFVSQELRPIHKYQASLEEKAVIEVPDLNDFDIKADLKTGFVMIDDREGSTVSISLADGEFKAKGKTWGFAELDFTPSDDVIRAHVAPLVAGSPEGSYTRDMMLGNPDQCTAGIAELKTHDPKTPTIAPQRPMLGGASL